jgi:hypothetical protein
VFAEPPILVTLGQFSLTRQEKVLLKAKRRDGGHNDPVAILDSFPIVTDERLTFYIRDTEYFAVEIIKQTRGRRPTMVAGDALVVCPEAKQVLLHRRGPGARAYKRRLNTFGGSYSPYFDHQDLLDTARRETHEEARLCFGTNQQPPLILSHQPDIGYLTVAMLGLEVTKVESEQAKGMTEGAIERVSFSSLGERLSGKEIWEPSGKAQVLSWLALGAPVHSRKSLRFGDLTGQGLFDLLVRNL